MLQLLLAFGLDWLIGDPAYPYHPARLMGRLIEKGEKFFRGWIRNEKAAGALLALSVPLVVLILSWALISILARVNPVLGFIAETFGIYSAISVRDLQKEGIRIYKDLGKGEIENARADLGRIVGRDTQSLDPKEILRASVETVAESTVDGVISPLFYAALGGAPLALAYKAVNTLDSMIGHRNERYRDFGFFAAKQDELWNWIPARLSYYVIALASLLFNGRIQEAAFVGWQDGISGSSGNSAIPEAAFAGALGLRLGGPSTYQGVLVEKPFLGFPKKELDREDLMKSIHLMIIASWLSLAGALLLKYGLMLCTAFH